MHHQHHNHHHHHNTFPQACPPTGFCPQSHHNHHHSPLDQPQHQPPTLSLREARQIYRQARAEARQEYKTQRSEWRCARREARHARRSSCPSSSSKAGDDSRRHHHHWHPHPCFRARIDEHRQHHDAAKTWAKGFLARTVVAAFGGAGRDAATPTAQGYREGYPDEKEKEKAGEGEKEKDIERGWVTDDEDDYYEMSDAEEGVIRGGAVEIDGQETGGRQAGGRRGVPDEPLPRYESIVR